MTVSEFIQELIRRKKTTVKGFSELSGVSLNILSNVKNDNVPGTWKTLIGAIAAAGLTVEDCLTLPPDPEKSTEDERALHTIRQALRRGGVDKETVHECAETLRRRASKKKEAG